MPEHESGLAILYVTSATVGIIMAWEMLWPRRAESPGLLFRWGNNLGLTIIGAAILRPFGRLTLVFGAWLGQAAGGGLLSSLELPWWAAVAITVLTVELAGYCFHRLMHRVPLLWRFHAMHHSDTGVDFTTTLRHHPVESLLNSLFAVPFIVLLAPSASAVLAAEVLRTVMIYTGHANIHVPEKLDRVLRLFLVTPDFHRLHHCAEQRYTNSNYSTVVPWFDYLFGTARRRPFAELASMQLGLEYYRDRHSSRLDRLLLLPFCDRRAHGEISAESAARQEKGMLVDQTVA